jgi:hypothetical protein
MLEWLGRVHDSELDTTMMALYHMWLSRNEARDKQIENPDALAKRIVHLTEEWRIIRAPKPPKAALSREHCLLPRVGWMKVNADGAVAKSSEKGGGGMVVRDHHGSFLVAARHFFSPLLDPEDAELHACHAALGLVKS